MLFSSHSSTPSSRAESVDLDSQDAADQLVIIEFSLQKCFLPSENIFNMMMGNFRCDIQCLVSRTELVERKMAEFAKSHNLLIDPNTVLEEEVQHLSAKVLNLEDRSCHSNVWIRGIPEYVSSDLHF